MLDPRTETVRGTWPGGATVEQLEAFLAGNADERHPEAAALALQAAGHWERCAATARERAAPRARDGSFALLVGAGLSCVLAAPADAPWRGAALEALEPLGTEALVVSPLAADDRAGLYEALVEVRSLRGDTAGARALAERWWAFLDSERKRGRTAEERAALDSYRVGAALALEDPGRALPALAASERALPRDYNPPARTARLLLELGRLDEARAAVDRALKRAYGPRKLRIYELAARVEERSGDRAAEQRVIEAALRFAEALPVPQQNRRLADGLRSRLARIGSPG